MPSRSTARTRGGSRLSTLSALIRLIKVRRPGSLSGFSTSIRRSRLSGSRVGPHFMPIGLPTPRRNSKWALVPIYQR